MLSVVTRRNGLRSILSNMVWVFVAGYFVYHMIIGARGIISWAVLSREVERLETELQSLKSDNEFLSNKVKGMRSDSLDLDLLEEEAEKILGVAYSGDLVVLLPRD